MRPRPRKALLTAHVACSVGWLGAVSTSLALAIAAAASSSSEAARGMYVALEVAGWTTLVPLSVASLLTGTLQSLASPWGLFRHHWVIAKALINAVAIVVLLMYMQTLTNLADETSAHVPGAGNLDGIKAASPIVHAVAAIILLVVATALSVFKPKGMTKYGQRSATRLGTRWPAPDEAGHPR